MTMGLAVIMIVLIGVMGAGLLTFVQRDLDAVIEVNKGQRAFEMADAGVQLAKRQLRIDPLPTHYDLDDVVGSVVSPVCDVPAAQATLNGLDLENPDLFPLLGGDWAPNPTNPAQGGMERVNLDGISGTNDRVRVTITWANPGADPSSPSQKLCADPDPSPPDGTVRFRVVSTGEYNGAKRTVEAIYEVYDLGLPRGFFAKRDVTITNNVKITDTSVFALGNISVSRNTLMIGNDAAYGDWYDEDFNLVRRRNALGPVTAVGLGAHGEILEAPPDLLGGRDHGRLYLPQTDPPDPSRMTFPFDADAEPDLELLKEVAIEQQNETEELHYFTSNGGLVRIGNPGEFRWPPNSTHRTVVFVEYAGDGNNLVSWQEGAGSCNRLSGLFTDDSKKGTLVVKGGDFTMQGNDVAFEGVVIVRGGEFQNGDYSGQGNSCLKGYANTSGAINLQGNALTTNVLNFGTRPGFYGVRVWSWRECYSPTCN
jgi:hypothetical protein